MPKAELEFFKPDQLPWEPVAASAAGAAGGAGVKQKILSRNEEGDVTRLLQFETGVGESEPDVHDVWAEVCVAYTGTSAGRRERTLGPGRRQGNRDARDGVDGAPACEGDGSPVALLARRAEFLGREGEVAAPAAANRGQPARACLLEEVFERHHALSHGRRG